MFETYNLKVFGSKEGITYNINRQKKPQTEGKDIHHYHHAHCKAINHVNKEVSKKLIRMLEKTYKMPKVPNTEGIDSGFRRLALLLRHLLELAAWKEQMGLIPPRTHDHKNKFV